MPLCPQITNTPVLVPSQVAITNVTYTSTTATYTASGHTFVAGDVATITGLLPAGYNGTFTITSVSGSTSFTVANTTNATVTDASGLATPAGDYVVSSVVPVVPASTADVETVQILANQAYDTAVQADLDASQAQATANGKNKVTYSSSTPGTTANTAGDIWWQFSGGNIIAQWTGAGGNSWTSNTLASSVIANLDAGKITAGTVAIGVGLNVGSGNFTVNASTGALFANSAEIVGNIKANSGFIGSAANGWNFSSSGFLTNSGGTTILYPTTAPGGNANTYSIFTDRGVYAERIYSTGTQASSIFSLGGLSVNGQISGGAGTFTVNTSGAITATTGITATGAISTSGNISTSGSGTITSASSMTANGDLFAAGHSTTANAANAYVFTTGGRIARSTASSQRYKENIVNLSQVPELDPKKLLDLPVRAFTYKEGELPETDDRYQQLIPGFIAEEVDAIYPIAADYVDGPESWNDRMIVPALLALIQDQEKRIKALEEKLTTNS